MLCFYVLVRACLPCYCINVYGVPETDFSIVGEEGRGKVNTSEAHG